MDTQITMTYKQWLDNEYKLWVEALESSTVENFKEHPQVRRMLSEDLVWTGSVPYVDIDLMTRIDNIGNSEPKSISGSCLRMIYHADKIIQRNPISIIEIGGGVGEFYAILRAMGYKGDYFIQDIPEVILFQNSYLRAVHYETGLHTGQTLHFDFCVSLYALGEFDDALKNWCVEMIVSKCPHGYVVWNPHSGASEDVPFKCEIIPMEDGSKLLLW